MLKKFPEKFQGPIFVPTQAMYVPQLADDSRKYLKTLGSKL
jgi:hypothetical protein